METARRAIPTLEQAERRAWEGLHHGVTRAKHAFHTLSLATVGLDGLPKCRTVVLRHVDEAARALWFHTDNRSPKFGELMRQPAATLLFYDAQAGLQVRAEASVVLHHGDDAARARWTASRPGSRLCYAARVGSSLRVPEPPAAPTTDEGGFEHFACAECRVRRLEWLDLDHAGHLRAEFLYDADGRRVDAAWLAP